MSRHYLTVEDVPAVAVGINLGLDVVGHDGVGHQVAPQRLEAGLLVQGVVL